jgi:glutamyl-Q tRNA(Asp) synthetase
VTYVGRFAPTPSGPLHAGSLVAALASWLDARAHQGKWLVRIEDVDTPRNVKGADQFILQQLHALGLVPDEPPVWQSARSAHYEAALQTLRDKRLLYACTCTRKAIEEANAALGITRVRNAELRYPGTCRHRIKTGDLIDTLYSLRVIANNIIHNRDNHDTSIMHSTFTQWHDRRLGAQQQDVQKTIGDFVLKRADDCYTYQLAVVVDDALQGITHVVRGEDLLDNTARQIVLQQHLGYATPQYLHTPLVLAADGEKLSKQNDAEAVDVSAPLSALTNAMKCLSLSPLPDFSTTHELLAVAAQLWRERFLASSDHQQFCK